MKGFCSRPAGPVKKVAQLEQWSSNEKGARPLEFHEDRELNLNESLDRGGVVKKGMLESELRLGRLIEEEAYLRIGAGDLH